MICLTRNRIPKLLGILLVNLLAISPAHADITGTVTLKGTPNSKDETFFAKSFGCGEGSIRHTENWKVGPKGELADAVVWIANPKFATPLSIPVPEPLIKQIGCHYDPHVSVVQAGALLKIINGDPVPHNILARAYNGPGKPPGPTLFNFGQAYQGQSDDRSFEQPGIYTLECNVHSWMQCWIMVLANACYATTGIDGAFKLQLSGQLLDGDYKIDAWHPRFAQPLEQTLHLKNGTALINLQFDATKSF